MESSTTSGEWLENELMIICKRLESGLDLDSDIISGLVSYCELAHPLDAKEYLHNIIGAEAGKGVIEEYLRRRGHLDVGSNAATVEASKFQAYVKPANEKDSVGGMKKQFKAPKDVAGSSQRNEQKRNSTAGYGENRGMNQVAESSQKGTQGGSRKKKTGKVISLAEAAKGSIVFQKGKPCLCQARQHRLVGNCLSCGKIVCEQEGEGPCGFCGALVLSEGSAYAGLEETLALPASDAEAAAEAYAKRLVDYDRNAAARTTVIDDQSDYYEIDSNSWLSQEEKELLKKKQQELEEAEKAKRSKVVVTFDLVGRKVLLNKDDVSELETENRILRPADESEREVHRIKPNPTLRIQPIFMDPGPSKKHDKAKQPSKTLPSGLCLEITGRVQHESNDLKYFKVENQLENTRNLGKVQQ